MSFREWVARRLAPDLKTGDEIQAMVEAEVKRAVMDRPVSAEIDGYRPLRQSIRERDLTAMQQSRMFEIAYYMHDTSAMTKRMARLDKAFLFAEPITITSEDEDVQIIIDRFIEDNGWKLKFPDRMMWLSMLGEQLWPVNVNPHNGAVKLGYIDPSRIKEVYVDPQNHEIVQQVELAGRSGRTGAKYAVIRKETDIRFSTYDRLVGDAFFFKINNPPNSARGRSDYLTLWDWIDSLEQYGFTTIERAGGLLSFIWDVELSGFTQEDIDKWLANHGGVPEPNSVRAHNEHVKWSAVSPSLNAGDLRSAFDMIKSFIMGSAGRPDSWYGGGGKAYQNEAEQFGQVPIKDLDERQQLIGEIMEQVIQFCIDQAVIHGRLTESQAEAGFTVNLPEISKKDFTKLANSLPQTSGALAVAEDRGWIRTETATKIFAGVSGQMGVEIDADAEIAAAKNRPEEGTEDYFKK